MEAGKEGQAGRTNFEIRVWADDTESAHTTMQRFTDACRRLAEKQFPTLAVRWYQKCPPSRQRKENR